MLKVLIIGAGAIGRGYVPWELDGCEIEFFDSNESLANQMSRGKQYTTLMSRDGELVPKVVDCEKTYSDAADIDFAKFDLAFVCIGPRNITRLSPDVKRLQCVTYSLENDAACTDELRNFFGRSNIFFGVPDVITSCTASPENLISDPLCLHTENGTLYLEDTDLLPQAVKSHLPRAKWISKTDMEREWDAKLFLHNTPHCIAAFLGYLHGCTYVHEALAIQGVRLILEGVVAEVLETLKIRTAHDHKFMEWYAEKEISRFANLQLFDPVTRVAREPIRKLALGGRLLGILRMALEAGVFPEFLITGIAAGLRYNSEDDPDRQLIDQVSAAGVEQFLERRIGLPSNSLEAHLISKAYSSYG